MPAGGPGDDPVLDIVRWRRPVYSPAVDTLIAEIVELQGSPERLTPLLQRSGLFPDRSDLESAEQALRSRRDALRESAQQRGWDLDLLDERIEIHRRAIQAAWDAGESRTVSP